MKISPSQVSRALVIVRSMRTEVVDPAPADELIGILKDVARSGERQAIKRPPRIRKGPHG